MNNHDQSFPDTRFPFTLPGNSGYIDSLTPLRGIAALWVVVFHYHGLLDSWALGSLVPLDSTMLIKHGYLPVDFFFILSGFIITHVYGDKLRAGGWGMLRGYLWARFTRLYPLHVFCMLLLLAFSLFLRNFDPAYYAKEWEQYFPFGGFFTYLFFGVSLNLFKQMSWNFPAWSIAAEWWAYVVAIFLMPRLHAGFGRKTLLAWVAALGGLTVLALRNGNLSYSLNYGAVRCVLEFSIGIGVYQLYRRLAESKSALGGDGVFAGVVAAIMVMMHFDVLDVLVLPLFGLLILCAALNSGPPRRILGSPPLRFLGEISYSVYLLHMFWIFVWWVWIDLYWKPAHPALLPGYGELLLWLALIFVAVIGSATLTYHFVEMPARNFLRDLGNRRKAIPIAGPGPAGTG